MCGDSEKCAILMTHEESLELNLKSGLGKLNKPILNFACAACEMLKILPARNLLSSAQERKHSWSDARPMPIPRCERQHARRVCMCCARNLITGTPQGK